MRLSRLELLDLADPDASTSPAMAHIGHAVRHPGRTLRLFVEKVGFRQAYDGWVDASTAVLHPEAEPIASAPVYSGARVQLPSLIAGLTDFGLRHPPTPRQALVLLDDLRRALIDGDQIPGLGTVGCLWTLNWASASGNTGGITVLDQGPANAIWLAVSTTTDEIVVQDAGSIGVWTQLGRLLPAGVTPDGDEPDAVGGDNWAEQGAPVADAS